MNEEKELLLKLLMEKYGEDQEDCDSYERKPVLGGCTGSFNTEEEKWEGVTCDSENIRTINALVVAIWNSTATEIKSVHTSNYYTVRFSFKGGCPKAIAKALWYAKPAGMGLVGDTSVSINVPNEMVYSVSFDYEYA